MFYGEFKDKNDMCQRFAIEESALQGCTILFAAYDCDSCCGNALVVFRHNHKLYEVNGSHCSCYGLEGQWEPEETTEEALAHRIEHGTLGLVLGEYTEEFRLVLTRLFLRKQGQQA